MFCKKIIWLSLFALFSSQVWASQAQLLAERAHYWQRLGRGDMAAESWRELLNIEPDNQEALAALAAVTEKPLNPLPENRATVVAVPETPVPASALVAPEIIQVEERAEPHPLNEVARSPEVAVVAKPDNEQVQRSEDSAEHEIAVSDETLPYRNTLIARALHWEKQGQPETAALVWKALLSLDPKNPQALSALSRYETKKTVKEPEAAAPPAVEFPIVKVATFIEPAPSFETPSAVSAELVAPAIETPVAEVVPPPVVAVAEVAAAEVPVAQPLVEKTPVPAVLAPVAEVPAPAAELAVSAPVAEATAAPVAAVAEVPVAQPLVERIPATADLQPVAEVSAPAAELAVSAPVAEAVVAAVESPAPQSAAVAPEIKQVEDWAELHHEPARSPEVAVAEKPGNEEAQRTENLAEHEIAPRPETLPYRKILIARALHWEKRGRPEMAAMVWKALLSLDPKNPQALSALSRYAAKKAVKESDAIAAPPAVDVAKVATEPSITPPAVAAEVVVPVVEAPVVEAPATPVAEAPTPPSVAETAPSVVATPVAEVPVAQPLVAVTPVTAALPLVVEVLPPAAELAVPVVEAPVAEAPTPPSVAETAPSVVATPAVAVHDAAVPVIPPVEVAVARLPVAEPVHPPAAGQIGPDLVETKPAAELSLDVRRVEDWKDLYQSGLKESVQTVPEPTVHEPTVPELTIFESKTEVVALPAASTKAMPEEPVVKPAEMKKPAELVSTEPAAKKIPYLIASSPAGAASLPPARKDIPVEIRLPVKPVVAAAPPPDVAGGGMLTVDKSSDEDMMARAKYWDKRGRSDLADKIRSKLKPPERREEIAAPTITSRAEMPIRPVANAIVAVRKPDVVPPENHDVKLSGPALDEGVQYWESRGRGDLAEQLRQRLKKEPVKKPASQGREVERAPDNQGAVRTALEDSLLKNPNSLKTRLDLAQLYRAAGEMPKARLQIESLLSLSPDLPEALFASAQLYADQRLWLDAMHTLERVSPASRTAEMGRLQKMCWAHLQLERADALVRQGKNQEAEILLRQVAIELAVNYNQEKMPEPPALWKSDAPKAKSSRR